MTRNEIRKHLSQCGVKSETVLQDIKSLSGGEQSKVKLCRLTLTLSNLLILDEITNHMDLESKVALKEALISYEGTVVLVSHEASFYEDLAHRIINIEDWERKIVLDIIKYLFKIIIIKMPVIVVKVLKV